MCTATKQKPPDRKLILPEFPIDTNDDSGDWCERNRKTREKNRRTWHPLRDVGAIVSKCASKAVAAMLSHWHRTKGKNRTNQSWLKAFEDS